MTKKQIELYQETVVLKEILADLLKGKKFKLECGHHVTFGTFLGSDITIYNGKELRITCAQCGY